MTATQVPPPPEPPSDPDVGRARARGRAAEGSRDPLARQVPELRSASRGRRCSGRVSAARRRRSSWQFIIVFISSFALFQVTNLTRGMVDNAIVGQTAPLWPYVTHLIFWAVWAGIFGFINMQLSDRLGYQIEFDLRVWLYTHVQSAELRNLDQVSTGQLVTRSITDLQLIEQLLRIFPTLSAPRPCCSRSACSS